MADRKAILAAVQNGADKSTWNRPPLAAIPGEKARQPAIVRRASQIPMKAVEWMWKGRIPLGMLTVFDGDPGLGKSTLLADLSARVTKGRFFPGDSISRPPSGVVIISFEDAQSEVIVPRLVAAGADLERCVIWDVVATPFTLPESIPELADVIKETGATFVYIDPLMAALRSDLNSHRDQDMRTVLAQLSGVAESSGAAIVMVRHLNKASGGSALYRGGGSIGIIGAARAGLVFASGDENDPDARVLAVSKLNVGKKAPSLALRVVSAKAPAPGIEVACIEWGDTVHVHADELVVEPEERTAIADAITIVRDLLTPGPQPQKDVEKAATNAGVSGASLRRAKKRLRVRSERTSTTGPWVWSLPEAHQ